MPRASAPPPLAVIDAPLTAKHDESPFARKRPSPSKRRRSTAASTEGRSHDEGTLDANQPLQPRARSGSRGRSHAAREKERAPLSAVGRPVPDDGEVANKKPADALPRIVHISELGEDWGYLAGNRDVHKGYRVHHGGVCASIRSSFACHNDTCNIWTHLLGLLMIQAFVAHAAWTLPASEVGVSSAPVYVYLAAVSACLAASTSYHVFRSLGKGFYATLLALDYAGVAVLITGALVPLVHLLHRPPREAGAICDPVAHRFVASLDDALLEGGGGDAINFSCSVLTPAVAPAADAFFSNAASSLLVSPLFGSPWGLVIAYDALLGIACISAIAVTVVPALRGVPDSTGGIRTTIFMATAAICSAPILHAAITPLAQHTEVANVLFLFVAMCLTNIAGAVVYATRIPERFAPGAFDLCLSSHSIFHCFINAAAAIHYVAVLRMWHWRNDHIDAC